MIFTSIAHTLHVFSSRRVVKKPSFLPKHDIFMSPLFHTPCSISASLTDSRMLQGAVPAPCKQQTWNSLPCFTWRLIKLSKYILFPIEFLLAKSYLLLLNIQIYKQKVAVYDILLKETDFNLFSTEASHRDTSQLYQYHKIFTVSNKCPWGEWGFSVFHLCFVFNPNKTKQTTAFLHAIVTEAIVANMLPTSTPPPKAEHISGQEESQIILVRYLCACDRNRKKTPEKTRRGK